MDGRKRRATQGSSGLTQTLRKIKVGNRILRVTFMNLQDFKECNVEEVRVIQHQTECDVVCLAETWHRPKDWTHCQEQRQRLDALRNALSTNTGGTWGLHEIPCSCNVPSKFAGCHGIAIFFSP